MKASLRLEAIGDNQYGYGRLAAECAQAAGIPKSTGLFSFPARQWVAELLDTHPRFGFERRFLPCKKDYRHSNAVGSRGVFAFYTLESGHLYEVMAPHSWKKRIRYYCVVDECGDISKLTEEEARAWLRQRSSDRSA